jgi:hypothetical protein
MHDNLRFVIAIVSVVFALGCSRGHTILNSDRRLNGVEQKTTTESVRRISVGHLRQLVTERSAEIISVMEQFSFDRTHIKGARSIPLEELRQRVHEIPRDRLIVTYCD